MSYEERMKKKLSDVEINMWNPIRRSQFQKMKKDGHKMIIENPAPSVEEVKELFLDNGFYETDEKNELIHNSGIVVKINSMRENENKFFTIDVIAKYECLAGFRNNWLAGLSFSKGLSKHFEYNELTGTKLVRMELNKSSLLGVLGHIVKIERSGRLLEFNSDERVMSYSELRDNFEKSYDSLSIDVLDRMKETNRILSSMGVRYGSDIEPQEVHERWNKVREEIKSVKSLEDVELLADRVKDFALKKDKLGFNLMSSILYYKAESDSGIKAVNMKLIKALIEKLDRDELVSFLSEIDAKGMSFSQRIIDRFVDTSLIKKEDVLDVFSSLIKVCGAENLNTDNEKWTLRGVFHSCNTSSFSGGVATLDDLKNIGLDFSDSYVGVMDWNIKTELRIPYWSNNLVDWAEYIFRNKDSNIKEKLKRDFVASEIEDRLNESWGCSFKMVQKPKERF